MTVHYLCDMCRGPIIGRRFSWTRTIPGVPDAPAYRYDMCDFCDGQMSTLIQDTETVVHKP